MNQYERANAVDKIHGYLIQRPTESKEAAFERAKEDAIGSLEFALHCVKEIDFKTFQEEPKR